MKKILIPVAVALILVIAAFYFMNQEKVVNEKKAASLPTAVTQELVPTESDEDFEGDLDDVSNNTVLQAEFDRKEKLLPTTEQMNALTPEEAHHTPEPLLEGAKLIGEALEEAEKDPARREATLEFFLNCSFNEEVVKSIRALCWNRATREAVRWDIAVPFSEYEIPMDIQKMSQQIN